MPKIKPPINDRAFRWRHRRLFVVVAVVLGCCAATYSGYRFFNPTYAFSQEQYDDGYYSAFRMNATGRAQMCYKSEFWSMQRGFDDALSDFREIYIHPNVGPFSYKRIDRLREVIDHIKRSTTLEPKRKVIIMEQLDADLKEWEIAEIAKNGG